MSTLPKKHAKPCPKCGGILWLKDYDPTNLWYGCENYKSQGCKGSISVDDEFGGGNGQRRQQSYDSGNQTQRPSKMICAHCGGENNVMMTFLAVGKPPENWTPKERTAKAAPGDAPPLPKLRNNAPVAQEGDEPDQSQIPWEQPGYKQGQEARRSREPGEDDEPLPPVYTGRGPSQGRLDQGRIPPAKTTQDKNPYNRY